MAEEHKFDTPDDADELVVAGQKDVKLDKLDAGQFESKEGDLLAKMIEFAKSQNGYNCITVSRLTAFVDKAQVPRGTTSALARKIFTNYVLMRGGNPEEFKKLFVDNNIVYIQAHEGIPSMAKDGLYDALDANGQFIKTRVCGEYVIADKEKFEPFFIVKNGKDDFGIGKGDPYRKLSVDEVEAVRSMNQDAPKDNSEANA